MNPNDYIAPTMPDEDKPCYLCEYCGDNPDFIDEDYCNLLAIGINDWGTCKHYKEKGVLFRPTCVTCENMVDNKGIAACDIGGCDKPLGDQAHLDSIRE